MTMKETEKCKICDENLSRYKCPTCLIKYCSVNCFKTHKENCHLPKTETESNTNDVLLQKETDVTKMSTEETEDVVSPELLPLLGESTEIKQLLQNPHLRQILLDLYNSKNPTVEIDSSMKEPLFLELANECLQIVENKS